MADGDPAGTNADPGGYTEVLTPGARAAAAHYPAVDPRAAGRAHLLDVHAEEAAGELPRMSRMTPNAMAADPRAADQQSLRRQAMARMYSDELAAGQAAFDAEDQQQAEQIAEAAREQAEHDGAFGAAYAQAVAEQGGEVITEEEHNARVAAAQAEEMFFEDEWDAQLADVRATVWGGS
jgi:hypothetical protein